MKTPVIQFGTSRFLQAHADLFLFEGSPKRAITVVQTSGDTARAQRLAALAAPEGYPVRIRGLAEGRAIDETRSVTSVKRCLSAATDWPEVVRVFIEEAEFVLSNTGDAGYQPRPEDSAVEYHPAMSFPAKLFHLLAARHAAGAAPIIVMPMELVVDNGRVLKNAVLAVAAQRKCAQDLRSYIENDVVWACSLVDRIVSEPIEPAGAVAEPYALWAIQKEPGVVAPCVHPAIIMVDDLKEIERLKLHILNLGHTVLVDIWQRHGGKGDPIVRDFIARPEVHDELTAIYREEVLPVFAHLGQGEAAEHYMTVTLERFANPYLDHRLADIAQNHAQKVERRIGAFLDVARTSGATYLQPRLAAIVAGENTASITQST
ncbi:MULTISPECIES: mannitol dehydrogenase family protein [Phyllobacteriaceae]|uniref:D-mannonate oxidoreductase n=1 Tax=Phyllobacterium phragmitis TaxID=2670329 RepID=A0ABQ0H6Z2_9HYPH|nr:mannitol dehydrogenase family protein [Mesorhizobium sp. RMAD-H1]MBB2973072.1 tagaturonate reductase [Mesorhizobium sp. RMAD-H1]